MLNQSKAIICFAVATTLLAACAAPAPSAPAPTNALAGVAPAVSSIDLSGIKSYLLDKSGQLKAATAALKATADQSYDLAKASNFDYAAMFAANKEQTVKLVEDARAQWTTASPLYEQMEGIVAGTPSLAEFDVILDAGASKEEDPQDPAPVDVTLPDGRVLEKPGNLFGVNESTLWGTFDKHKQSIIKGAAGQFAGLLILGFTNVYREGFETALFLQALTLEGGAGTVLIGAAVGMALVLAVGLAIFALQAKLPIMKMLIFTGILIGFVLLVMVGNTVHIMQVVGWMPLTPIR
jgi:hypothetical protein